MAWISATCGISFREETVDKSFHDQYVKLCMAMFRDPSKIRLLRDRMAELLYKFGR